MFFDIDLLIPNHGGRFSVAWISATRGTGHMRKKNICDCNIVSLCEEILQMVIATTSRPRIRLSLRLSSYLINGLVKIHREQVNILLTDLVKYSIQIHKPAALQCSTTRNIDMVDSSASVTVRPTRKRKRKITVSPPVELTQEPSVHEIALDENMLDQPAIHVVPADRITMEEEPLPKRPVLESVEEFGILTDEQARMEFEVMSQDILQPREPMTGKLPSRDEGEKPSRDEGHLRKRPVLESVEEFGILTDEQARMEFEVISQDILQPREPMTGKLPSRDEGEKPSRDEGHLRKRVTFSDQLPHMLRQMVDTQPPSQIPNIPMESEPTPQIDKSQEASKVSLPRPVVYSIWNKPSPKVIVRVKKPRTLKIQRGEHDNDFVAHDKVTLLKPRLENVNLYPVLVPCIEQNLNLNQFIMDINATSSSTANLLRLSSPLSSERLTRPRKMRTTSITNRNTRTATPRIQEEVAEEIIQRHISPFVKSPIPPDVTRSELLIQSPITDGTCIDATTEIITAPAANHVAEEQRQEVTIPNQSPSQDIKSRLIDIRDTVKNWDLQEQGDITIEQICKKPVNRRNIANTFSDLLMMHKMGYVKLNNKPDSLELGTIEKGEKILNKQK